LSWQQRAATTQTVAPGPEISFVGGDLVLDGAGSVETAALVRVGGDLVIRGEISEVRWRSVANR
jgi:ethanolamine utilization microcompartment shell protein EutS